MNQDTFRLYIVDREHSILNRTFISTIAPTQYERYNLYSSLKAAKVAAKNISHHTSHRWYVVVHNKTDTAEMYDAQQDIVFAKIHLYSNNEEAIKILTERD